MMAWPIKLVAPSYSCEAGRHYTINSIDGDAMVILRDLEPDDLNWVFLSTSGVHGSYTSLDEIEKLWTAPDEYRKENYLGADEPLPDYDEITVVIVMPRMVTTFYGNAAVRSLDDVALLRKRVEQTIAGILKLQEGNRERHSGRAPESEAR